MENILGQLAQTVALMAAVFFALGAGSGIVNLYLRFHDRLSIDREDVLILVRNTGLALLSATIAWLFYSLPFFTALTLLLCGVVIRQLVQIHRLIPRI